MTTIDADSGPRGGYGRRPTINTAGTVAFQANIDAGGSGIFASSGGTVTTIAQTTGPGFSAFNDPSINDAGLWRSGEIGVGGQREDL